MLNTQEYLKSGKTLQGLETELSIVATKHDTLPLVILNYDQIESPKTHPIVRECRALILNTEDWGLVARSFNRFYNWGECADEMELFDWSTCQTQEKVDGSLCLIFYFNNEWHVSTRGSFAGGQILNSEWQQRFFKIQGSFTWKDAILSVGIPFASLDPALTYVCEFCSPWNKVVRDYSPRLYELTCFAGEEEVGVQGIFTSLFTYPLTSVEDIKEFVNVHPEATFEGCVVKDRALRRWKIKNPRYLAYHRMKGGNGDGLYLPKNLVPFILAGETDEVMAIYPEVKECCQEYKDRVDSAWSVLKDLWEKTWKIESQKDFALSIVGKTAFTGILFTMRKKYGNGQDLHLLRKEWGTSGGSILKMIF